QLGAEGQQPGVQFVNRSDRPNRARLAQYFLYRREHLRDLFYVIHRTRSVEQEHARAARLWIINEFGIREWYLIGRFCHGVVFHIVINILKTGPRRPNIRKTFQKSVALESDLNYLPISSVQHRNSLLPASPK